MEPRLEREIVLESRRRFLGRCLALLGVGSFGGGFYPVFRYLTPPDDVRGGGKVEIEKSELPLGAVKTVLYRGQPTLVIHSTTGLVAISAVCTHLGCIVKWQESRKILFCPCHAARFDPTGKVLGGPVSVPLEVFPVIALGDKVVVGV